MSCMHVHTHTHTHFPGAPELRDEYVRAHRTRTNKHAAGETAQGVWTVEHGLVRKALAAAGEHVPMPRTRDRQSALQSGEENWLPLLPLREHDLVGLMSAALKPAVGDACVLDITEPASHSRLAASNLIPCMLRTHRLWLADHNRPLLGLESMFVLGFPKTLRREGLTDTHLRSLAGNSMSVQFYTRLIIMKLLSMDITPCQLACERPPKVRKLTPSQLGVVFELGQHPYTMIDTLVKRSLPGLTRRQRHHQRDPLVSNKLTPSSFSMGSPCGEPVALHGKSAGELLAMALPLVNGAGQRLVVAKLRRVQGAAPDHAGWACIPLNLFISSVLCMCLWCMCFNFNCVLICCAL